MDKKELITEIIDLADKVEELERENAELRKAKERDLSFEDLEEAGRARLFDYAKSCSLDYSYDVRKDGKLLVFSEWLDTLDTGIFSTSYGKVLNNHSFKELVRYFIEELSGVYNAKLDKIGKEVKGDE